MICYHVTPEWNLDGIRACGLVLPATGFKRIWLFTSLRKLRKMIGHLVTHNDCSPKQLVCLRVNVSTAEVRRFHGEKRGICVSYKRIGKDKILDVLDLTDVINYDRLLA